MKQMIAIQGIPGSFHHQVAIQEYGREAEILTFSTFEEVAKAVFKEEATVGVMAIENSIAGAILPNYDLIDRYGLKIIGEYYLSISHQFMVLPGQKIEDIHEVRSHPMALLQCKAFLNHYPKIKRIDDIDTATVAKRISEQKLKGVAAIASEIAAEIYNLEILVSDIQSVKSNFTRFIFLGKTAQAKDQTPNKASIKITIQNKAGSLARLLTHFSNLHLDLSKIQSIPVIVKPWEYAFFIDLVFDNYHDYHEAMRVAKAEFGELKILGEYHNRKA
ncbi:prephenate dehydratase [uncultured Algoriphagus sp.]|uniref:prephenate dehydratase n=1 Tax=uncultured Algoriphagus sp. TaxID=417365 RepID=UPI0025919E34|nr:prephenate dehydratase [uncultured Algoriphagus sp.]